MRGESEAGASVNDKRRPRMRTPFGVLAVREGQTGEGFREGGCSRYEEPLAARKVRLRVSGAQAIDTIMPISSTAASTIMV